jgi:hypothetical protein
MHGEETGCRESAGTLPGRSGIEVDADRRRTGSGVRCRPAAILDRPAAAGSGIEYDRHLLPAPVSAAATVTVAAFASGVGFAYPVFADARRVRAGVGRDGIDTACDRRLTIVGFQALYAGIFSYEAQPLHESSITEF